MVSLDSRFVLDCAQQVPSALGRFRELRQRLEPLFLSVAARAAVMAEVADRDEAFRDRAEELLRSTEELGIDLESVRFAAEIAGELARQGRQLDGVDLFVAAGARQYGHIVVSRYPGFEGVPGLVCQSY